MRKTIIFVLGILIGLGGCGSAPQPQIAFHGVDENGATQIYLVDLDGDNLIQLTDSPRYDDWPVWSPDGQQIAFRSGRDYGWFSFYLMNADGSDVRRFTDGKTPSWSPDGEWIAYSLRTGDGNSEIFKINVITGEVVQLTNSDDIWDENPAWSPSGEKIVYSSGVSTTWGYMDLVIMDADGSNKKVLIDNEVHVFSIHPEWSPRGDKILFLSNEEIFGHQLYIWDIEREEKYRLTDEEITFGASWSPDGERIIFNSHVKIGEREVLGRVINEARGAIFVINVDGTGLMEIPIEGVPGVAGGAWRP